MTLYDIDRKAFDPYWNESHHEALAAMIEAGYIREVETDDEPLLGLATTRQLLQELEARIDLLGELDYRTVDGDRIGGGDA